MPDPRIDGASVMASADANCARLDRCCVENVQPAVRLTSVSVNVFGPETLTLAVSDSPARTGLLLQVKRKGTWETLAVSICSAKGVVTFNVKLKNKGTYSYRVYWQGGFGTYAAASNTVPQVLASMFHPPLKGPA